MSGHSRGASGSTLTADRLREVLDYDAETGVFRWRVRRGNRKVGAEAGTNLRGYRNISVDWVLYRGHRLAWLYVYGIWPTTKLDHRNGKRDDNRIANLREDPKGRNQQNVHGPRRNNRTGFLGASRNIRSGRFDARIRCDGARVWLGSFDTPAEASAAYLAAKRELHPFWEPK